MVLIASMTTITGITSRKYRFSAQCLSWDATILALAVAAKNSRNATERRTTVRRADVGSHTYRRHLA
jgi:hypothetical protein